MRNVLIYKKSDTLQKSRQFALSFTYRKHDTLRYAIFHKLFEFGIYIQEAWNFSLCNVYIYKNIDISQEERQFALRFNIQQSGYFFVTPFLFTKSPTLYATWFFMKFLKLALYIYTKSMTVCVTWPFLYKKPDISKIPWKIA